MPGHRHRLRQLSGHLRPERAAAARTRSDADAEEPRVVPLAGASGFGAEMVGFNLTRPLSEAHMASIVGAFEEHSLCVALRSARRSALRPEPLA
jgi:hypothetical protein